MSSPTYSSYKPCEVPWLHEIPASWEVDKFRHCFRESNEKNGPTPTGEMLSISGYRGVEIKEYDDDNRRRTVEELEEYRVVRRGQLAVNTMWLNHAGLGVSSFEGHISPAYRSYWISHHLEPRFVHHLMRSSAYVDGYTALLTGIRPNSLQLSRDDLMSFPVLVPPRNDQLSIAGFLDRETAKIDALIDKQEQLIAALREDRAATITRAVTRGLDPDVAMKDSSDERLGYIPAHWSLPQIGWHTKIGNGSTPARDNRDYWMNGSIPWLNSGHVNRERITDADQFVTNAALLECHLPMVPAGSVLVGLTGQGKTRGMASLLTVPSTVNQHLAYITPDTRNINSDYLCYALRSSYDYLRELSEENGSTKGGLTCSALKKLRLPIPPKDEQVALVNFLDERCAKIDSLIEKSGEMIVVLREYRSALITNAVTGKIDVREAV